MWRLLSLCRAMPLLALLMAPSRAGGVTFVVGTPDDAVDTLPGDGSCATSLPGNPCSLRAAIQEANALPGLDRIELPAAVYELSIAGQNEELAATGDLDVLDDLELAGEDEATTIVDGGTLDRVLDLHPPGAELSVTLRDLTLRRGQLLLAMEFGGCVRNPELGTLDIWRVTFRDCRCQRGGALSNSGAVDGGEVTFDANMGPAGLETVGEGGAIRNDGPTSTIYLRRALFTGNRAGNGAGIYSTVDIGGGGRATIEVRDSTFVGNQASQFGGGVHGNTSTDFLFENCTFSGNDAGFGGAVGNDGACFFALHHCTIVGNSAAIGGGISEVHFAPEFIELRNTILAGNTASFSGPDCHLRLHSDGGSLIGDLTDCDPTLTPTDLTGVPALLGPLVLAHALDRFGVHFPLAGSPAIDGGDPALCAPRDARALARPQDGDGDGTALCDRGAVELAPDLLFHDGFEDGSVSRW